MARIFEGGARQQAKKDICKLKQTKHDVIWIVRTMLHVMHVMLSMLRPTMGPFRAKSNKRHHFGAQVPPSWPGHTHLRDAPTGMPGPMHWHTQVQTWCVCDVECSACFTILSACCTVTVPPLDRPSTSLDRHHDRGYRLFMNSRVPHNATMPLCSSYARLVACIACTPGGILPGHQNLHKEKGPKCFAGSPQHRNFRKG